LNNWNVVKEESGNNHTKTKRLPVFLLSIETYQFHRIAWDASLKSNPYLQEPVIPKPWQANQLHVESKLIVDNRSKRTQKVEWKLGTYFELIPTKEPNQGP